ncbi:MAG: FprA family A-type flavoprotein [Clostridiales Family XIII bacterium]|jgi:flavorubredoxin|nr:FprA family A-type flavoprotein [Clostridiales Family XIII bacterium]
MHVVRKVTDDLYWVGANDRRLELFENIHPIPNGVSYNSYLLLDNRTVLFDTVDWRVCRQFLDNIAGVLGGRPLDYIVINHMEPDHAASMGEVLIRYPEARIITTEKAVMHMRQFGFEVDGRYEEVAEGDTRSFGAHKVVFIAAPMVHWPEAMVTFDTTDGVLFSADAFGSFGSLDGRLFNDEVDFDRDWLGEARRYLTNIVGKYGPHIQLLLRKASNVPVKVVCPLHGPVWRSNLEYFIDKYDKWSRYEAECDGVAIIYASMYGNTESAAFALAARLADKGLRDIAVHDVSNTHVSYLVSETFRVSHIVLASVTYNLGVHPLMQNYLTSLRSLNLQNRTFALIENGTWTCRSGDIMTKFIEEDLRNMRILKERLTINSSMNDENLPALEAMADSLLHSIRQLAETKK